MLSCRGASERQCVCMCFLQRLKHVPQDLPKANKLQKESITQTNPEPFKTVLREPKLEQYHFAESALKLRETSFFRGPELKTRTTRTGPERNRTGATSSQLLVLICSSNLPRLSSSRLGNENSALNVSDRSFFEPA